MLVPCVYHGNTHIQFESSITSDLKDMAKVKVFVHATDADGRAMTLAPKTYLSRLIKNVVCKKILLHQTS